MTEVQIPGMAVSEGKDVREPVRNLLEDLNLLGTDRETERANGFMAAFSGPPQSVALIEAGATAATKWWATSLGAAVIATWGTVTAWWGNQEINLKLVVIGGAAIVTAALVVSIGYLIASDVSGRAAAAVATINARVRIAEAMISAAEAAYKPAPAASAVQIVPLPSGVRAKNHERPAVDEDGWLALAMERHPDGTVKFIIVKGSSQETVPAAKLTFA